MKIWGKLMKNNRLLKDYTAEVYDQELNRTRKVYKSLEMICHEFDIAQPIWLELNKKQFICHNKTRFNKDSFLEDIEFDYLEFQVIEEDY
ncbi:MAG: hypothetical protein K5656_02165 [Lachnospiraceae bacterium]|nr:hypothetical protein [Lachnospiraceae bacterium]